VGDDDRVCNVDDDDMPREASTINGAMNGSERQSMISPNGIDTYNTERH
jgi:hypothetical protein